MAKQVDIWWDGVGKLKASLRWTNKKGRISFYLIPNRKVTCEDCPFKDSSACEIYKFIGHGGLCNELWELDGDNKFVGRDKIIRWQPRGPLKREKKKKDKF